MWDEAWDIGLLVEPAETRVESDTRGLSVDTIGRRDLAAGVFELRIERDPVKAGVGSRAIVEARREAWRRGKRAVIEPVEAVRLLGLPGHAYGFRDAETFGFDVVAVEGACVYSLVVMRSGSSAAVTTYGGEVLRNVRTTTGRAARAPRCRPE